jgi:hypothetical protein
MVDEQGRVHKIKWKICTKINYKEKLLAPKLDNFWKHGGRRMVLVVIPRFCNASEYYMDKVYVNPKKK